MSSGEVVVVGGGRVFPIFCAEREPPDLPEMAFTGTGFCVTHDLLVRAHDPTGCVDSREQIYEWFDGR